MRMFVAAASLAAARQAMSCVSDAECPLPCPFPLSGACMSGSCGCASASAASPPPPVPPALPIGCGGYGLPPDGTGHDPTPCRPSGATPQQGMCVYGDHCLCSNGYVCADTLESGECTIGSGGTVFCVPNPTPPGECKSSDDFNQLSQAVTAACCTASSTCVMGLPKSCPASCASVLLPVQDECEADGAYLAQTSGTVEYLRSAIDAVAALCSRSDGH